MAVTYTLAYYVTTTIMAEERFIIQASGHSCLCFPNLYFNLVLHEQTYTILINSCHQYTYVRCHDILHDDTQFKDAQAKGLNWNTQH
jgi:hypothetical protein